MMGERRWAAGKTRRDIEEAYRVIEKKKRLEEKQQAARDETIKNMFVTSVEEKEIDEEERR